MRKFLTIAVLALLTFLASCSSSSNNAVSDECTENPTAPGCETTPDSNTPTEG